MPGWRPVVDQLLALDLDEDDPRGPHRRRAAARGHRPQAGINKLTARQMRVVRAGRRLRELPGVEAAHASGELTAAHVAVVTAAVTPARVAAAERDGIPLGETDRMLAAARQLGPEDTAKGREAATGQAPLVASFPSRQCARKPVRVRRGPATVSLRASQTLRLPCPTTRGADPE